MHSALLQRSIRIDAGSDFNDLIRATRLRAAQGGNAKALTPDTDSDAVPRSEEAGMSRDAMKQTAIRGLSDSTNN